jgi:hypothetical protein
LERIDESAEQRTIEFVSPVCQRKGGGSVCTFPWGSQYPIALVRAGRALTK